MKKLLLFLLLASNCMNASEDRQVKYLERFNKFDKRFRENNILAFVENHSDATIAWSPDLHAGAVSPIFSLTDLESGEKGICFGRSERLPFPVLHLISRLTEDSSSKHEIKLASLNEKLKMLNGDRLIIGKSDDGKFQVGLLTVAGIFHKLRTTIVPLSQNAATNSCE